MITILNKNPDLRVAKNFIKWGELLLCIEKGWSEESIEAKLAQVDARFGDQGTNFMQYAKKNGWIA